ncbi:MAG: hypothetical protein H7Z43_06195 [Clostridia bacterium]|nr:hypothetical protein [Deltaproteobacteria bacterium]
MALFGLFGGAMSDKGIDKSAKLAANPFAQPDVRMREMHRLLSEGTPAALGGLLRRFTANASGHIADEDEKKWLENALVDVGEDAIEPLKKFIRQEEKITYALHAFSRIAGPESAVKFYLEVLEAYGPEDHRASEAKVQLVHALAEHTDNAAVLPTIAPFVLDHADEVRTTVLDVIDNSAEAGILPEAVIESLREPFATLVCDAVSVGPRVQRRAVELLEKRSWQIAGAAEELAPLVNDIYFLDKKRIVRKRAKK